MSDYNLDVIRQAIEERDAALEACESMADRMEYHDNSVSSWYSKANNYGNALTECWKALNEAEIYADGKTTVADAIRKLYLTKKRRLIS